MNAPFSSFCAGVLISALYVIFVSCDEKSQTVDEKPPLVDEKPQTVQVSNIELAATLSLEVGEKQTLTATILPADAENRTVSWISGDENIAEVSSSGEVTAAGAGATIIIATAANGRTASCTVIVTAKTEQEPESQGEDVPFKVYSARWANLDYFGKILVIDSDKELKKYVVGDYPPVDFAKHTLLLTRDVATNGINKINAKLTRYDDEYWLSILVKKNMTAVVQGWHLAVIIPKLSEQERVKLNIKYQMEY